MRPLTNAERDHAAQCQGYVIWWVGRLDPLFRETAIRVLGSREDVIQLAWLAFLEVMRGIDLSRCASGIPPFASSHMYGRLSRAMARIKPLKRLKFDVAQREYIDALADIRERVAAITEPLTREMATRALQGETKQYISRELKVCVPNVVRRLREVWAAIAEGRRLDFTPIKQKGRYAVKRAAT